MYIFECFGNGWTHQLRSMQKKLVTSLQQKPSPPATPHMYDMIRVHCGNLVTVNVKCLYDLEFTVETLYGIGIWWFSPYLIWNRYCMVPHIYSPHMYNLMVQPYLIWNRYHMAPPHVCMVPNMYDMIFSASSKESTACPNELVCANNPR